MVHLRAVQRGRVVGAPALQLGLLAGLAATAGLSAGGWAAGLTCLVGLDVLLVRSLVRAGLIGASGTRLGAANAVTLGRATLACGVAALVVTSFSRTTPAPPAAAIVGLAVVALALDAVDGRVARRTGTVSAVGARFDMEADAFLILVLAGYLAPVAGWWVLAIGLARYVLVAASWAMPWLRAGAPARSWRKVVAAVQGIVLVAAASGVLPAALLSVVLATALALLAWSFGTEAWWLWRHRDPSPDVARRVRGRAPLAVAATGTAVVLVWFAVAGPASAPSAAGGYLRLPLDVLVVAGLAVALPDRLRAAMAVGVGGLLGLLTVLKLLDLGSTTAVGRPFDPLTDWRYLGSATGLLRDSLGAAQGVAVAVAALVLAGGVLVLMPLSVLRLTTLAARRRAGTAAVVSVLGVGWTLAAALGLQAAPGVPVASTGAAGLAVDQVRLVRADRRDREQFAREARVDAFRDTPADRLLTGLRGKDVLLVFVESYGRAALEGPGPTSGVVGALDAGTQRLQASGYASASAFLTSPTFGGISWLAHSTLQSGTWVDSQRRYDDLVAGDRFTLSQAFGRAGWRTVSDVPSNRQDWPPGRSFYRYDQLYDARNVGYRGPSFSYASMPDQYTLAAFRHLELTGRPRPPVMAEIDLVSSHTPWAPVPRMVDPDAVGDGSVYDGMPAQGQAPGDVWPDVAKVRAAYATSIAYSLDALTSFVAGSGDDDLVLVVLGDHQPASIVSGARAGHDVPVSIIARDPAVLDRVASWGWQPGLRPSPSAPVWPMDTFRDRFLSAYR
ncbi:CDP-alcohol phosphatidyltransferase family protein [Angustibacter luteus]|uniref:CDP-alcohol phosphatidyltransferase family protein n=1 Tax=Angustibacter luteus TaxID=658456 RepID=UPI00366C3F70